jgi:proteasome assembly chaperone (PAC2) family protein
MGYLELEEVPSLREPLFLVAFAGWNDAGEAATTAAGFLGERWSAQRLGHIDPEEFFDFTSSRPIIRLGPGFQRELEWPSNALLYHADPALSRDVVLLLGTEPHLRWRAFVGAVLEVMRRTGASVLVSLGAFLGDTPHSRPVPLTGFATDEGLTERLADLSFVASRYEGPTGVIGAIHDACRRQGLPSASLWASVSHYLGTTVNPKAAAALVRSLNALFDLRLDLQALDEATARFEAEVAKAISRNAEVTNYVQELERRYDAASEEERRAAVSGADLPTSETVIRDVEEYLRGRWEGEQGEQGEEKQP